MTRVHVLGICTCKTAEGLSITYMCDVTNNIWKKTDVRYLSHVLAPNLSLEMFKYFSGDHLKIKFQFITAKWRWQGALCVRFRTARAALPGRTAVLILLVGTRTLVLAVFIAVPVLPVAGGR